MSETTTSRQAERALPTRRKTSCPCCWGTPCNPHCSCVTPASSHGCQRCCAYGSDEQRRARAEHIARVFDSQPDLLATSKETRDALAGAMRIILNYGTVELVGRFEAEMVRCGIKPGVGVRADAAIAKAQGGAA